MQGATNVSHTSATPLRPGSTFSAFPTPAQDAGTEAEVGVLSTQLAMAEKQALELRRDEAERSKQVAAMTAKHEAELAKLEGELRKTQRQLDEAMAKAKHGQEPTPGEKGGVVAKKPSKFCEVQ